MCACPLGSSGLLLFLLNSVDNGAGQSRRQVGSAARKLGIHGEPVNTAHFPRMGPHLVDGRSCQCPGSYVQSRDLLRLGSPVPLIES